MTGSWRKKVRTTGKKSLKNEVVDGMVNDTSIHGGLGMNAPKKIEESKCLNNNADKRPSDKDEKNATDETNSATELLFAGKEVERLLRSDDKCESGKEQNLVNLCQFGNLLEVNGLKYVSESQKTTVEEENDT